MSPQVERRLCHCYARVCLCKCGKRHTRQEHTGAKRTRGDTTHHHHLYECPSNRDISMRRKEQKGRKKDTNERCHGVLLITCFIYTRSSLPVAYLFDHMSLSHLLCHHQQRPTSTLLCSAAPFYLRCLPLSLSCAGPLEPSLSLLICPSSPSHYKCCSLLSVSVKSRSISCFCSCSICTSCAMACFCFVVKSRGE